MSTSKRIYITYDEIASPKSKGWYNSVKSAFLGDVISSLFSTAYCEINNEYSHQAELEIHSVDNWETPKVKGLKQLHFAKHIFSMITKSPFSSYPLLNAVIYIEIAVIIYENSIKWKKIFTRLLSIAFCTRRRIVQGAFCKHDKVASPDEITSPYVIMLTTAPRRHNIVYIGWFVDCLFIYGYKTLGNLSCFDE